MMRLRNLSSLMTGGLSGFTFWHYQSDFALNRVLDSRFFADASGMMRKGDFLAVTVADGGALLFVRDVREGSVETEIMASTGPTWDPP